MDKSILDPKLMNELFHSNTSVVNSSMAAKQISPSDNMAIEEPIKEKSPLHFSSYRQEIKEDDSEEVKPIDKLKKFVKGFMPGFAKTTIMKFNEMNGDIKKIRDYFEEQRAGQEQNKDHMQYGLHYRYYDGIIKEIERITS